MVEKNYAGDVEVSLVMSKAAMITGLFVAILFLYLFVMLRQTMHSVSKIEAFSSADGKKGGSDEDADGDDGDKDGAVDATVGGTTKMDAVSLPSARHKAKKETFENLAGTNTTKLKSLLVDDPEQHSVATAIEREEEATIPRHTLGITAPEGIPFPAKNDVIGNDDQRIYWIANIMYELNPDNGMAQFIDEVRGLAERHRDHTFAEIIAALREHVKTKETSANRNSTIDELVHITKELTKKVKSLPSNGGILRGPRPMRDIPAPLEPDGGVEMFVNEPDPSSYQRAYSSLLS
jgi:hypothetical protein